ncbi:MAG: hypothetical protein Q4D56_14185 [Bacteroides sp.]|nr:hypothetical protein [Bacteroides sp.]
MMLRGVRKNCLADWPSRSWNKYPVLHLDLNTGLYNAPSSLFDVLNNVLAQWETLYSTSTTAVDKGRVTS